MTEDSVTNEETMVEKPAGRKPSRAIVTAIAAIIIVVVVVIALMLTPAYSPLASIHDADGDGVADDDDAFPNDASETKDTDGDGYGDNSDEFPEDADEWEDTDGDGYGDNGDAFLNDAYEWLDTDDDGVGDNADAFPTNPTQWADRDGDGYGDNPTGINPDAFPDDPTEWIDSDSDGIGDNADFYDQGNGKITISVDRYQGDGTADFWTYGDPFFEIRIDTDDDELVEYRFVSPVFTDTELLVSPWSVVVDLEDDIDTFGFSIRVYDSDLEGNYFIDCNPSPSESYCIHDPLYPPFDGSWSCDGSDDGLEEADCILEYSLSVGS